MIDLIVDLQQALRKAKDYDGYSSKLEKQALVFAIEKAILHAKNQLI